MSTINTNSEAYHTGYESALQGELRCDCPYAAGTWDAANWLAGYDYRTKMEQRFGDAADRIAHRQRVATRSINA